ncbi:Uncharacterised protein family (UPF0236) [Mycobacteroides abscessus subsp. abscessus]|nr:Uncharacterised protein family (UPF0236) [Mycobacteroides abscessus subsp. abscessus]
MNQCNIKMPSLKELEKTLFRTLQMTFQEILIQTLENWDQEIAKQRDKRRFALRDKREIRLDTAFGAVELKRNYYFDRVTKKYICLLDHYLQFQGNKGFSPLLEEWGLELATNGSSYRKAVETFEQFLGYSAMSHEALRQHLLQTSVLPAKEKRPFQKVLFVEVDGLYVKSQEKKKRGWELKFAAVHEGWKENGKRVRLRNKRHFLYEGKEPFWEAFETFLQNNYAYDPTQTLLIINGDGAGWITACREYFRERAFFTMDRFHVARSMKQLMKSHPRYRYMKRALKNYQVETLLLELNSAVGTMDTPEEEEKLEHFLGFLTHHQETIKDYRSWLQEKGVDTTAYRPMGSAEAMMNQLAKRLKNGRAWSKKGVMSMARLWIGLKDDLSIQTIYGKWEKVTEKSKKEHRPKREIPTKLVTETVRQNIPYLNQAIGKPIHFALQGLKGF